MESPKSVNKPDEKAALPPFAYAVDVAAAAPTLTDEGAAGSPRPDGIRHPGLGRQAFRLFSLRLF